MSLDKPGDCSKDGCERKATRYLELWIPAIGHPASRAMCLTSVLPYALCKDHAEDFDTAFVTDEPTLRRNARDMLRSLGRADPDFDRAEVKVRMIGDEVWNAAAELMRRN